MSFFYGIPIARIRIAEITKAEQIIDTELFLDIKIKLLLL
jgi:hypothetical protein